MRPLFPVSPSLRLLSASLALALLTGCQSGAPQLVENTAPITAPASNPPVAVEAPADTSISPEEAEAAIPESVPETAPAETTGEEKPATRPEENEPAKAVKKETAATAKTTTKTATPVEPKAGNKVSHPVPAATNPPPPAETFNEGQLDAPPNPEKPKPSKSENLKNASIKVPEKR